MSWSFFFDLRGKVIEKTSDHQIRAQKKLSPLPRFYHGSGFCAHMPD